MKNKLYIILFLLTNTMFFGQTAYIEVKGEPNLSVYLNGKFKGKTTTEFNGLIIENVNAGSNVIKVEKEGYTSFEETISIKSGEVFAYKVKPFTKHAVYVSEEGNAGETEQKASVKTGKLIIQSVPIEIKITIPNIEGINNSAKTKDKWLAEEIPEGTYKITFTYNQKVINKTIEILGNETTSIFVNMLSSDFKTSNSLEEKNVKTKEDNLIYKDVLTFIDSFCLKYKFKSGLTESEFRNYNPEASNTIKRQNPSWITSNRLLYYIQGKRNDEIGPKSMSIENGIVTDYGICLAVGNKENSSTQLFFSKLLEEIKTKIPSKYIYIPSGKPNRFEIIHPKINTSIEVNLTYYDPSMWGNSSRVDIEFIVK